MKKLIVFVWMLLSVSAFGLRADLNGDCIVNIKDLAILASEWMQKCEVHEMLGPELVVNGTFDADTDWTKGAGWTIGGNVASYAHDAAFGNLEPTVALSIIPGRKYQVKFELSTSGGIFLLTVKLGGTTMQQAVGDGPWTVTGIATNSNNLILDVTSSSAGATFNVDDISVMEIVKGGRSAEESLILGD